MKAAAVPPQPVPKKPRPSKPKATNPKPTKPKLTKPIPTGPKPAGPGPGAATGKKPRRGGAGGLVNAATEAVAPEEEVSPASAVDDEETGEEQGWRRWLAQNCPTYVRHDFARRHVEFWDWVWAIREGQDAAPFVAIWPRGGAKSTSAELAVAALGVRSRRRYAIYVCETQAQADTHIANVANLLEKLGVARAVNTYGSARGWRRNRLITSIGFTVDALGLDAASRGAKIDEDRPDLMVFDDIDGEHDTLRTTDKKVRTITNSILPAGAPHAAILLIQNLISSTGVFARLANVAPEKADFLVDRHLSGPHPAVQELRVRTETGANGVQRVLICGGTATWAGQDLVACQAYIDKWGWKSFDKEAQHNVGDDTRALWNRELIGRTRVAVPPELEQIVVGVDPPGSTGRCGIVVAGSARLGGVLHAYTLEDASTEPGASPREWAMQVVAAYHRWSADVVVLEVNMGGTMVKHTLRQVEGGANMRIVEVRATRGKRSRAEPIAAAMEEGREHHAGVFPDLENQMCRWVPGDESPDPMDAKVWALSRLLLEESGRSFCKTYT